LAYAGCVRAPCGDGFAGAGMVLVPIGLGMIIGSGIQLVLER
jgi:hypothetical protein